MRNRRKPSYEQRPQRLKRYEIFVLLIGYLSIIYWIIRLFVYILYRLDPFITK